MEAPHRFDLVPTACVNKEVVTQHEIAKDNKSVNCAEIENINTNREHVTQHGLHINGCAKDWITSLSYKNFADLYIS